MNLIIQENQQMHFEPIKNMLDKFSKTLSNTWMPLGVIDGGSES